MKLRPKLDKKNLLIVLCAGQGRRLGYKLPKMLVPVAGKPLLYWTLKNLESVNQISAIRVVAPLEWLPGFKRLINSWKLRKQISLCAGGVERNDSTRNALEGVSSAEFALVGVHDGARAFVPPKLVDQCFSEASRFGAAILAVPAKDTIKLARSGKVKTGTLPVIKKTVPRNLCWIAQTPQVFKREWILKMHGASGARIKNPTDDAYLAESFGFPVRMVLGSYDNIKVTTPEDLALAKCLAQRIKS